MLKQFLKRTLVALSVIFMIAVYLCAGAVSIDFPREKLQTAYFIVESTDSVAASAEMISLRGGAGYVTADGKVAFNVYFSKTDADRILATLLSEYPTAELRTYVKRGGFDKEEAFLFSVIKTVEGWGQVLKQGVSQERIRCGLQELSSLLSFRQAKAANVLYDEFSKELDVCTNGVITLGKLRYFLCFASERLWELL